MINHIKTISKTVAATGTAEAISKTSISVAAVKIKAKTTNTVACFIGDSASQDYPLSPGEEIDLSQLSNDPGRGNSNINLQDIFVKVGVNGEGVSVIYCNRGNL